MKKWNCFDQKLCLNRYYLYLFIFLEGGGGGGGWMYKNLSTEPNLNARMIRRYFPGWGGGVSLKMYATATEKFSNFLRTKKILRVWWEKPEGFYVKLWTIFNTSSKEVNLSSSCRKTDSRGKIPKILVMEGEGGLELQIPWTP